MLLLSNVFIWIGLSYLVAGRPSLSDPFGLGVEPKYEFGLRAEDYVNGSIWPKPQSETRQETIFSLDPANFKFVSAGKESDVLDEALVRYKSLTFPDQQTKHVSKNLNAVTMLEVTVEEDYAPLQLESDESSNLHEGPLMKDYWEKIRNLKTAVTSI